MGKRIWQAARRRLILFPDSFIGHGVSLGSYEYLVYEKVFVAVAAEFGLQPVTDYASDRGETFKAQYHEHRPLHDLLEQVSCNQLAACCCESPSPLLSAMTHYSML